MAPDNIGGGWRDRAGLALMAASGFAALGYQIVWTQQGALWLGHEAPAVLAVVTAFFGGLAVGALACGGRIERSAHPVRWYAACELVIAAWSLLLLFAMPALSATLLRLTGVQPAAAWQWTVAFLGSFLMLLPATAAMGATLPAMERITTGLRAAGRTIAPLYASNTFGALLGVLGCAFWLVPELGLARTAGVCGALNLLCAAAAVVTFAGAVPAARTSPPVRSTAGPLVHLALTGLLGIGYEVLVVRVLAQVAEDTVYTFALLLAVYLVGSAGGAALYQRWLAGREAEKIGDRLLCACAAACLLGIATLWGAEHVKAAALATLGPGMSAALGAETTLALLAFALPTIVMGALFSHLAIRATASGSSFGRALGANTLGAAAAPLLFGVLAFPAWGAKLALLAIVAGYLALAAARAWRTPQVWLPAGVAAALALFAPRLAFIDVAEGGHIVSYAEGVMAAVSVVEDADGVARLRIDNRQQEGSSATLRVDARQALLPVLLHPAPRRALFLGVGTGVTAAAAAQDPALEVDAVELLPDVIVASQRFTQAFNDGATNPRLHLIAADARRFVRTTPQRYDVIVADNFHPARSGAGSLYTVEHFAAVRDRLRGQGVFCQWLPLHQLDLPTLRTIAHSFISVFPDGWALLASNSLETPVIGLVARAGGAPFDLRRAGERLARATFTPGPAALGIEDEFALFGAFVAGPAALRQFAGDGVINSDDRPVVAYRAPRITYAPDSLPRERLVALLHELDIQPRELVAQMSDEDFPRRLRAYWLARNHFIESGQDVRPSPDVRAMLAQVREPLLSVLRQSPDFRPAYDPLLLMAGVLARTDANDARVLLSELAAAQPARREAALALLELGGR